ncbi:hypothetical protein C8F04DRAFT_1108866 [Mycena alexandri]|uniref:Uncharacterized protein n=1 Tax=Mycena alexandri TaxID=1745969 RepID=A0AAD6SQ80_9AGAR|nr:hypothetical protein C8F04DRAFT_1108866 [Mycena alexandri]
MSILRSSLGPSNSNSVDKDDHPAGPGDRVPQNVADVRQNFKSTAEAIAVVTTLFAGIQAQLLSGTPSEPSPTASQAVIRALQLASYGGLSVNVGAALSSMLFLDIVGEGPKRYRRWSKKPQSSQPVARNTASELADDKFLAGLTLLVMHGSPRSLHFAWYHCVASTVFGTISVLIQISLLAWINLSSQDSSIFAAVVLALFWAALPVPGFLIYNFFVGCMDGVRDGLREQN